MLAEHAQPQRLHLGVAPRLILARPLGPDEVLAVWSPRRATRRGRSDPRLAVSPMDQPERRRQRKESSEGVMAALRVRRYAGWPSEDERPGRWGSTFTTPIDPGKMPRDIRPSTPVLLPLAASTWMAVCEFGERGVGTADLKKTTARERAKTPAILDSVAPTRPGVRAGSSWSGPSS